MSQLSMKIPENETFHIDLIKNRLIKLIAQKMNCMTALVLFTLHFWQLIIK